MDGKGPQPLLHYVGRLCEEFHLRPSEVIDEMRRLPPGTLERIIRFRTYAATKAQYDATQPGYEHPVLIMVKDIESEIAADEIRAQQQQEERDAGLHG